MANNLIAPRQFFTVPSWVPQPPQKTDSEEPSETTLWPGPETTAANDENDDKPASTQRDDPKSSLIMEESTITGGLTTKTDSGRTVTVPNDEIVTITRHTTIVTDKPPTLTTAPTEPTATLGPPPDQSTPAAPPVESGEPEAVPSGGRLSTGVIVGVGVGGAALIAFIVIMVIVIKRRVKKRKEEDLSSTRNDEDFGGNDRDEKYFPQQMSAHTTGNTQGSGDPFAPFGGRVDANSAYPNRPASNTFEMDATPAAPVELPDTAVIYPGPGPGPGPSSPPPRSASTNTHKTDPRSNLEVVADDEGKPTYINHWNQYRAMGSN